MALLEDISPSGACLQTEIPVPLRTGIRIDCNKGRFEGSVSYCFFRDAGYTLGVTFAAKTRWSQRQYRPKHLLNIQKLMSKTLREARVGPSVH